jgi:NTE family protein
MALNEKKSTCYDGGLGDNTPIRPLYDKGYRDFYVVYLINQGKLDKVIDRKNKDFPDAKIYNIYPEDDFKSGIFATLTINKENTRKLMQRGYKDMMKFLKDKIVSNNKSSISRQP